MAEFFNTASQPTTSPNLKLCFIKIALRATYIKWLCFLGHALNNLNVSITEQSDKLFDSKPNDKEVLRQKLSKKLHGLKLKITVFSLLCHPNF